MKKSCKNGIPYRIFNLLLVIFSFVDCNQPQSSKKIGITKDTISSPIPYVKPASSFNDTLTIKEISAVFFNPDSLQLEKIKTITEKNHYETDVHNCFYLMRNARRVIKQYYPQVHIIEVSKIRYLLFEKADKSKIFIDLNKKNDMCGIFLFNRNKVPELIDMMNIDTSLWFYFKN